MESYIIKHSPGAEGVEIQFRRLSIVEVLANFPELLDPAFPESGRGGMEGVERARKRALERAGAVPDKSGVERLVELACRVINRACVGLVVHDSWAGIPRNAGGVPLEGHFYFGQLGADLFPLYEAILDASGLSRPRLARISELLKRHEMVVGLDILGQRYGSAPSALLDIPRTEPGGYVLDLYAAKVGEEARQQAMKAMKK